ncbi:MAG: ankyrin repeat domain-containing protein [Planctomycetes bacterium]|nr:ankyrin repeat domain-containing protein [Planctomycetota bacterium]
MPADVPYMPADLYLALRDNRLRRIRRLVSTDPALLESRSAHAGLTPLLWAAHYGHLELARWLISRGADTSAVGNDPGPEGPRWQDAGHPTKHRLNFMPDLNALSLARLRSHLPLYRELLDIAADRDLYVAMLAASVCDDLDWLTELLENGAPVEPPDALPGGDDRTPLVAAVLNGNYDSTGLLIRFGADVHRRFTYIYHIETDSWSAQHYSWPLVMFAAAEEHHDVLELLLANGADVNATESLGHTALDLARRFNLPDTVEFLLRHGGRESGK